MAGEDSYLGLARDMRRDSPFCSQEQGSGVIVRSVIDNAKKGREVSNLRGLTGLKNVSVLKCSIHPRRGKFHLDASGAA
jgi:hypothetical protein